MCVHMTLYAPIIDKLNTTSEFNRLNNPNPQFLEITAPIHKNFHIAKSKPYCIESIIHYGCVPIYTTRDDHIYPSCVVCIHDEDYKQFLIAMVVTPTPTDESLRKFHDNIDHSTYKQDYEKGKRLEYIRVQPIVLLSSSYNERGHNIYTDIVFYMEEHVLFKERRLYMSIPTLLSIIDDKVGALEDYEHALIIIKTLLQLRFIKSNDSDRAYNFIKNTAPSLECWSECIRSLW